jgi:predicted MFS family arabinose efflux permease
MRRSPFGFRPSPAERLSRDAALVCAAGSLRAASVSLAGVLIAIHFAGQGLSTSAVGAIIGVGMTANAVGTIMAGLYADAWGRRRTLVALGLLTGAGYIAIAWFDSLVVLLIVAAVALLNGMGRDRGPASAIEQALLPSTTSDVQRTWTMAWYNAAIDVGHAVGAGAAILPTVLTRRLHVADAHAITFALCGAVLCGSVIPYVFLGSRVEQFAEPARGVAPRPVDERTRRIVYRLTALFGLDSTGGGFLSSALVAYWFFERYGMSEAELAGLFFAARVLNVCSHLAAAWLARRIGLVNTMVFTHLPSSVFLMLAPAAATPGLAAALFLAREALVEMDVPTRQSYVMAVVPSSARTYASGLTNVARNAGWAVGPLLGGAMMQHVALAAPLLIGGSLKIAYDLVLYRSFRNLRPPEEQSPARSALR